MELIDKWVTVVRDERFRLKNLRRMYQEQVDAGEPDSKLEATAGSILVCRRRLATARHQLQVADDWGFRSTSHVHEPTRLSVEHGSLTMQLTLVPLVRNPYRRHLMSW